MKTIDWRGQLCQFLKIGPESTDETLLESLETASEALEEAHRLLAIESDPQNHVPKYQTIHRVSCVIDRQTKLYVEEPFVVNSGPQGAHLRGTSEPLNNFDLFLERNKAISFIAYLAYRCCDGSQPRRRHNDKEGDPQPSSLLTGESASIISPVLCAALKALTDGALDDLPHPDFSDTRISFHSPYLWWFCRRQEIAEAEESLSEYHQEHITLFKQYLQDSLGATWSEVDSLLAEGKISAQYINYLFVSNLAGTRTEVTNSGRSQILSSCRDLNMKNLANSRRTLPPHG